MISNIELAFIKAGDPIARDPGGYWCRVEDVDRPKRIKVRDTRVGKVFWIRWDTAREKWRTRPQV